MSKVKIEGNASGTGTLTIAAPNTNTDRTLTLPDEAGEIVTASGGVLPALDGSNLTNLPEGGGPAFIASMSANQSVNSVTQTKLQFDTESKDTDGCYDPTTNYRFTPTTEGYYHISAGVTGPLGGGIMNMSLFKNGSLYVAQGGRAITTATFGLSLSAVIYMNGSTDYLEVYGYQNNGVTQPFYSAGSLFSGCYLRGA